MNKRIEGIDYLRAIMSVFVVIWHMGGGGRSLIFSMKDFRQHTFTFSDFVNFHLLLLAVPAFILVSNYLYVSREITYKAFQKRMKRLLLLLSFWAPILIVVRYLYTGQLDIIPDSISSFIVILLRAGNTKYYFFVSLILTLLFTHSISKLKPAILIPGFILSIIFIAFLPLLTKIYGYYQLSAYWNPLNFIPYCFAALLIKGNEDNILSKKYYILVTSFSLFFIFSIIEWNASTGAIFFPGQGFAIPAYTRTSLIFGTLTLLIFALDPKIKSGKIVSFMSKYSLALYCLHPFLMEPVSYIINLLINDTVIARCLSIFFVIIFSYLLAAIFKKHFREELLT
ncbi:MAG: acyltransferase [Deltaproteobacteria bacterium]|nr:acyltransferase [Deltaproteobacteria bacterium]